MAGCFSLESLKIRYTGVQSCRRIYHKSILKWNKILLLIPLNSILGTSCAQIRINEVCILRFQLYNYRRNYLKRIINNVLKYNVHILFKAALCVCVCVYVCVRARMCVYACVCMRATLLTEHLYN
jgi:hypothetical protein